MTTVVIKDKPALLRLRNRIENVPEQEDNGKLPAYSPMYFYCKICGHQSDVKGESYTSPVRKYCKECQELKEANPELTDGTIIESAKAAT